MAVQVPRLSLDGLGLDRYGVGELADILEARARVGLEPESVTRQQLERIADQVAGVARAASRRCVQPFVGPSGVGTGITDDVLDEAYALAQRSIWKANLASLPFHYQVLYELVRTERAIEGEALHERYEAVAGEVYQGRPQTPLAKGSRRRTAKARRVRADRVGR